MTSRSKKTIIVSLLTVGILFFILKWILFFYLMEYAPKQPNVATGEIYPLNNHGYIFYVIKIQSLLQDVLFYAFFIFAWNSNFGTTLEDYPQSFDDILKTDRYKNQRVVTFSEGQGVLASST
jgi:hypothetical protein